MTKRELKKLYAQIAKNNGVTVAEVRREIELATQMAQASADPIIRANWEAIPRKGKKPKAAEMIAHLAREVQRKEGL